MLNQDHGASQSQEGEFQRLQRSEARKVPKSVNLTIKTSLWREDIQSHDERGQVTGGQRETGCGDMGAKGVGTLQLCEGGVLIYPGCYNKAPQTYGWRMCCAVFSRSVTSNFLRSLDCSLPSSSVHGEFSRHYTQVGCHALLQGVFPT